jgi:hypothetical protein
MCMRVPRQGMMIESSNGWDCGMGWALVASGPQVSTLAGE